MTTETTITKTTKKQKRAEKFIRTMEYGGGQTLQHRVARLKKKRGRKAKKEIEFYRGMFNV